jgi:hypothetical protein
LSSARRRRASARSRSVQQFQPHLELGLGPGRDQLGLVRALTQLVDLGQRFVQVVSWSRPVGDLGKLGRDRDQHLAVVPARSLQPATAHERPGRLLAATKSPSGLGQGQHWRFLVALVHDLVAPWSLAGDHGCRRGHTTRGRR